MLDQLYSDLKDQLLAIDGMATQVYQAKTGNAPTGGIEQFLLKGKNFVGLRRTDQYVMVYLGPVLSLSDFNQRFNEPLKSIRSGKGCLKITKPEKTNLSALSDLLKEGAAQWE